MKKIFIALSILLFVSVAVNYLFFNVNNYSFIINGLKLLGYNVEKIQDASIDFDPLFKMECNLVVLQVNSNDRISIYLFKSAKVAKLAEENVIAESVSINWLRPSMYRKNNLLVMYTGVNSKLLEKLKGMLGEPRTDFR